MGYVLVVDDEAPVRGMLDALLTQAGHRVETAHEGGEALELLAQADFDLIILDLLMPGMEGMETLTRLRKTYPELKVIVISGGSRAIKMDLLPAARALGAHRVIRKPFHNEAMLTAVAELLAESAGQE